MSTIGKAIGKVVGGITGSNDAAKGAQQAAQTQAGSAQAGIDEQKRQFDAIIALMKPFVTQGQSAVTAQGNLIGLGGVGKEQAAINALQNSPTFQALAKQGETAILQNAAATGGLRGGNVQGALAQYRPQLLNQQIQQRFANLGDLTQFGQAAAAGQASAGQSSAANIANLLGQQGAALAGGQLAKGGAQRQAFGDLLQIGGAIGGFF